MDDFSTRLKAVAAGRTATKPPRTLYQGETAILTLPPETEVVTKIGPQLDKLAWAEQDQMPLTAFGPATDQTRYGVWSPTEHRSWGQACGLAAGLVGVGVAVAFMLGGIGRGDDTGTTRQMPSSSPTSPQNGGDVTTQAAPSTDLFDNVQEVAAPTTVTVAAPTTATTCQPLACSQMPIPTPVTYPIRDGDGETPGRFVPVTGRPDLCFDTAFHVQVPNVPNGGPQWASC